jgi:hypothetical protein
MRRAASIPCRLAPRWSSRSTTTAAITSTRPRKKSATRATSASCRRHGIFIEVAAATSNDLILRSASRRMGRGREWGYCGTYFVATIDTILIKVLNNLKETIAYDHRGAGPDVAGDACSTWNYREDPAVSSWQKSRTEILPTPTSLDLAINEQRR